MTLRRKKNTQLSQLLRERMAVLGTALALRLRREGECCLKGSACASRQAVGAWGCLAELLGKGLRGVCIEAKGFGWLFFGSCAQIPQESATLRAPASRRFRGKPQRAALAPLKSVGVLLFVASLQISLMKLAGTELLEQRSGNACKQHPEPAAGGDPQPWLGWAPSLWCREEPGPARSCSDTETHPGSLHGGSRSCPGMSICPSAGHLPTQLVTKLGFAEQPRWMSVMLI